MSQHSQFRCAECDRLTLHTRDVVEFQHMGHFLAAFFLCGLWLPFWLLSSVGHNKYPGPFRCTQCGHAVGSTTVSQQNLASLRKEQQGREAAIRRRERQEQLEKTAAAAWNKSGVAAKAAGAEARRMPGRVDRVLRAMAGEGNDILYHFFQVFAMVVVIVVAVLAVYSFFVWAFAG